MKEKPTKHPDVVDNGETDKKDVFHRMIEEVQDYAIILLNKEGIIQNWNKGAEKIKQYHESEAVGKPFQMFYLPEDRARKLPEKLINEAAIHGRAIHEGWRLRKDQTKFWGSITLTALHDDNGGIIGFSKVTRDLTERKIAEDQLKSYMQDLEKTNEALRKSEERYHRMIAEVEDYAIILLNERGDILNWNAGAEKIKGYKPDEIIGKNFRIFYLPEDQERKLPETLIQRAIQYGKAVHEGWRVRKNGSKFWGSIVITALHSQDGSLIGFSKVTRDLTERKHSEDRAKEYLVKLEAQNKELEQFAYVASHDLQEPLRKIRIFTEVIEKNFNNDELVRKYFGKINASAQRMSELINSILNYSRLSVDEKMVHTNLNQALADVLADFELLIQEKNAVISSDPLPVIKAIPPQINQLFTNIIGNALKFTRTEPVIKISSAVKSRDQISDPPPDLLDEKYLELSFADNGIGFDQQYEEQIFSLFQRLHGRQEYSGTGIGLALCKRIMENHRGLIRASGESGKGAKFFVYFPLE